MNASPSSSAQSVKPEAHLHHRPASCPNCGSTLSGNFCQECGQAATLHVASAREFLHEFIGHYVALEGKLWQSVKRLMFKPGQLTRDYIEGRRVRYVEPLRLYLSFSIIFFALFKLGGLHIGGGEPDAMPSTPAPAARAPAAPTGPLQEKPVENKAREDATNAEPGAVVTFDKGDEDRLRNVTDMLPPSLAEKTAHFSALPSKERNSALKRAFFSYAPYAIFLLMPVFAAFLKLLYLGSGRRYGEHVLFALHSNAFAFLCLSLMMIVPDGIPLVTPALVLWLVFYLPTAMRKVYGGSRFVTSLRWMVLMTAHSVSILLAALLATIMGMMG